jgi:hypothetical protein
MQKVEGSSPFSRFEGALVVVSVSADIIVVPRHKKRYLKETERASATAA